MKKNIFKSLFQYVTLKKFFRALISIVASSLIAYLFSSDIIPYTYFAIYIGFCVFIASVRDLFNPDSPFLGLLLDQKMPMGVNTDAGNPGKIKNSVSHKLPLTNSMSVSDLLNPVTDNGANTGPTSNTNAQPRPTVNAPVATQPPAPRPPASQPGVSNLLLNLLLVNNTHINETFLGSLYTMMLQEGLF
jgi:hypothetical protein